MNRIVHVLPGLHVGGAERALERILGAGLSRTFENHIIGLSGEGEMRAAFEKAGAQVHVPATRSAHAVPAFLHGRLKALAPQIVQGWMYHANVAATVVAGLGRRDVPTFWNIRQSLSAPTKDRIATRAMIRLGALFSGLPRAIIYNSDLARRQHEDIGYSAKRSVLIPNGFDGADHSHASSVSVRKAVGLPDNHRVIIHVGRFHPVKDHRTFLLAADQIAKRSADVSFVLAGRGVTWENDAIASMIAVENRPRFHLLGERGDVGALLGVGDIFVLSSVAEAFPNALGEAMAAGLACVATEVGDVSHMLADCGKIVAPADVAAMTAAIEGYLGDSLMRERDSARARQRIAAEYGLDAVASRYTALYQETLAQLRNSK